MPRSIRDWLWILAFATLATFSIPWFLWRSSTVVAGLPIWLWWHVGWMGVASIVFALFARTGWDRMMGVDAGFSTPRQGGDP